MFKKSGVFLAAVFLGTLRLCADDILLFPTDAALTQGVRLLDEKFLEYKTLGGAAEWQFEVSKTGEYNIFMEFSVIGWAKGSEIEISVDDEPVASLVIPDTWNSFRILKFNTEPIEISRGEHMLVVKPLKQKNNHTMGKSRIIRITQSDTLDEMVDSSFYAKGASFAATMWTLKKEHPELNNPLLLEPVYKKLWGDFPHQMAWMIQDIVGHELLRKNPKYDVRTAVAEYFDSTRDATLEKSMIGRVLDELDDESLRTELSGLNNCRAGDVRWLELYEKACKARRAQRLKPLLATVEKIVFAKHQVFGSQSGIYNITETEGLVDGEISSLNIIDLSMENQGGFADVSVLKDAEGGILRDPDISYDGKRMLFAWRKTSDHFGTVGRAAPDTGNYQVYEMNLDSKQVRQLTDDSTYGANYEAIYLPNGNIMFNSARIVQHITCGWGDHSNLFVMTGEGKYQRRVGFDQVSSQFPTVLNNGQVVHLRRDYNDRGQASAHALIVMNPDGTGQTEYYGNQTGVPNSFMHARAIPDSDKVACVLSGYHTRQGGQLALIDIRKGQNYGEGIEMIPQGGRPPYHPGFDDGYLKAQVQYANPYPLSETEFVVSRSDSWAASPTGGGVGEHYAVYFMTSDNRRELLAYDPTTSCLQPVPVIVRPRPPVRAPQTDYTKDTGTFYMQDVYLGAASKGITNKVKKIRVVEILYKHDTINSGTAYGPGGGNDTVTPPAHPLALFDAKRIIGEATVYEDGSALFEAPARTPVYFQLLDEKNRVLQTMRSWTTLIPNERFSCVGCHENKYETPGSSMRTMAMQRGLEQLAPFYGEPRGFSFQKEVQPIFDKHCISCHAAGEKGEKLILTAEPYEDVPKYGRRFSQSYVQLMAARPGPKPEVWRVWNGPESWNRSGPAKADEPNRYVRYWTRLGTMGPIPPYSAGSITSGMIDLLEKGHKNVTLSQEEWDKLCAWIDLNCPFSGDYMEGNIWKPGEQERYRQRIAERKRNEAIEAEAIKAYIEAGQP